MFPLPDGKTCGACSKTNGLQQCSTCRTALYCSRECQREDFKAHKKFCPLLAQHKKFVDTEAAAQEDGDQAPRSRNLDVHVEQPFQAIANGTWLHGRSEKDTFKLLIDSFRLRMEDQYRGARMLARGTIYDMRSDDSSAGFSMWLPEVESRVGVLPDWWSKEKANECVRYGMEADDNDTCLSTIPSQISLLNYWEDESVLAQLRMFAERIEGWSVIMGVPEVFRNQQLPAIAIQMSEDRLRAYTSPGATRRRSAPSQSTNPGQSSNHVELAYDDDYSDDSDAAYHSFAPDYMDSDDD